MERFLNMEKTTKIEVPVVYHDQEKWLLLNCLGNTGKLRAVSISKSRLVHEADSHQCNEASAKSSIRYHPKRWKI